jgi:hypothetical protein
MSAKVSEHRDKRSDRNALQGREEKVMVFAAFGAAACRYSIGIQPPVIGSFTAHHGRAMSVIQSKEKI